MSDPPQLPPSPEPRTPSPPGIQADRPALGRPDVLCPRCGKSVPGQSLFCPHCEVPLSDPRAEAFRRSRRRTALLLALGALALIGGFDTLAVLGMRAMHRRKGPVVLAVVLGLANLGIAGAFFLLYKSLRRHTPPSP